MTEMLERFIDIHLLESQNIYGYFKFVNDSEGYFTLVPDNYVEITLNRKIVNAFYHLLNIAQSQETWLKRHYSRTVELLQSIHDELLRLKHE